MEGREEVMESITHRVRKHSVWFVVCGACLLVPAIGWSQQAGNSGAPNSGAGKPAVVENQARPGEDQPDDSDPKARTVRGRLPDHFGKLGISRTQRERIYEIQAGYREQIEKLQKQIMVLEQEANSEVESVLTDDQRTALRKFVAEAEARRRERSKNSRED